MCSMAEDGPLQLDYAPKRRLGGLFSVGRTAGCFVVLLTVFLIVWSHCRRDSLAIEIDGQYTELCLWRGRFYFYQHGWFVENAVFDVLGEWGSSPHPTLDDPAAGTFMGFRWGSGTEYWGPYRFLGVPLWPVALIASALVLRSYAMFPGMPRYCCCKSRS